LFVLFGVADLALAGAMILPFALPLMYAEYFGYRVTGRRQSRDGI
jgi:hypothetical protein